MPDLDTVLSWRGKTVLDRDGEKVGTLGDLYLDRQTDLPAYAGVRTGLFKQRESIVPLDGAREVGGDLQVPFALETIEQAPNVDPEVELNEEEEERLHEHYGEPSKVMPQREAAEMTRSEEEVDFRVEPARPKERVRLRKHVVVDHVEKTVPVRREEIRLEHDPPKSGRIVSEEDV
jgi:sporulation protein YlmC with PRC-barrel domain